MGDVATTSDLRALARRSNEIVDAAAAANTRRTYRAGWDRFARWCDAHGLPAGPPTTPEVVLLYLTGSLDAVKPEGGRYSASTMRAWVAAIDAMNKAGGQACPGQDQRVGAWLKATAADQSRTPRRSAPLTPELAQRVVHAMTGTDARASGVDPGVAIAAARDVCLVMVGLAGAFRASELVAVQQQDVEWHPPGAPSAGVHVTVRRSKTDQSAAGMVKFIPQGSDPVTCPACALWRWMAWTGHADHYLGWHPRPAPVGDPAAAGNVGEWWAAYYDPVDRLLRPTREHVCGGPVPAVDAAPVDETVRWVPLGQRPVLRPLFKGGVVRALPLSRQAVTTVVKHRARAAGLAGDRWSSHSLRAGFVTAAVSAGASFETIVRQTGHKSAEMVALYHRVYQPGKNNAVTVLDW